MEANVMEVADVRLTPQWMRKLSTFIGDDGNEFALKKEQAIEKKIIELLEGLDIHASVKTDRYSLPVHGSVMTSNGDSSYVPDIYDSTAAIRKFLKVLLDEDCRKVRFYVYIYTTELENATGFKALFGKRFNIEIRYYLHN